MKSTCKRCGGSGVDPEPEMVCCGASAWQCGGNHCCGATAQPKRCSACRRDMVNRAVKKMEKHMAKTRAF